MRFSPDAPIQMGGCGCCTGRGSSVASLHLEVATLEGEAVGRQQAAHDLHRFFEPVDALLQRGERNAERVVLPVEPRGAVGELEPAVRRVVDGDGLGREDRRVPVGHAGDEQPEPCALGDAAPCREGGVPFEALTRPVAVHRLEVVETPDAVEPQLVGEAGTGCHLRPRHPLLGDVESVAHSRVVSQA